MSFNVTDFKTFMKLKLHGEPPDVIRWATKNAGECMGQGDPLGMIAPGKLADLLVVRGDPSKNISILGDPANLPAIMKDGQFVKETL